MKDPAERLRDAIIQGNLLITKRLLSRFPEFWLNSDPKNGWTNLHYASYYGHYLICFHLIQLVAQVKDNDGTLLNIYNNKKDMLAFDGVSALHVATENHHLQLLHYLLQEFPGTLWLNHGAGDNKWTPLHYCCVHGFHEGAQVLLEYGADSTINDIHGNNLLHLSFAYGNFNCVKVVAEYSYDNKNGRKLKSLEKAKNNRGWIPVELCINFSMTKSYKEFKKALSNRDLSSLSSYLDLSNAIVTQTIDIPSASTASSSNGPGTGPASATTSGSNVLFSPIIPMSNATQKRSHSQSLPATSERPSVARNRSNTTTGDKQNPNVNHHVNYNHPSYNHPHHHNLDSHHHNHLHSVEIPFAPIHSPSTPVMRKTPSLKALTISPSIRSNTNSNSTGIDNLEFDHSSSSTTANSSPIKTSLNKASSFHKDNESIDSPSSIAAKIAFSSSRSSLSHRDSPNNSHSSSPEKHHSNSPSKSATTPIKTLHSINSISFSRVR